MGMTGGWDMKFLIVEDNALTRFTIKSIVESMGHQVVAEAEDSAGAMKGFTEQKPDIVLLDLILPGKSGVEILGEIKKMDPGAKVIVITAVEQAEIDRRLQDKGVSGILRKPFSVEEFKGAVAKVL